MTTDTLDGPRTRGRGKAYTYADTARILKISKRQVIREVRAGKLKAVTLSPRVSRIFDSELDSYIEAQGAGQ